MKTVCQSLHASTLKQKLRIHLRRSVVSRDMRDFATIFPELQEARHLADYDPGAAFPPEEVSSVIDSANAAMAALDRLDPVERTDLLALLMIRTRD